MGGDLNGDLRGPWPHQPASIPAPMSTLAHPRPRGPDLSARRLSSADSCLFVAVTMRTFQLSMTLWNISTTPAQLDTPIAERLEEVKLHSGSDCIKEDFKFMSGLAKVYQNTCSMSRRLEMCTCRAWHLMTYSFQAPSGLRKLMNSMVFRKPQSQHKVDRVKLDPQVFRKFTCS